MYIYRANIASRGTNLQQARELSFEHWLIASKLFFSSWERHRQRFGQQKMHRKVSSRRLRVIHVDFQTSIGLIYSLLCMEIGCISHVQYSHRIQQISFNLLSHCLVVVRVDATVNLRLLLFTKHSKPVYTLQPIIQPAVQPDVQPDGRNVLNIHIINE